MVAASVQELRSQLVVYWRGMDRSRGLNSRLAGLDPGWTGTWILETGTWNLELELEVAASDVYI